MKDFGKSLRREYITKSLNLSSFSRDPIKQFSKWFSASRKARINEPNAMALGSVSKNGQPSVRFVLMKHFDGNGLTFFTNYKSRKGEDFRRNPKVAATFYWQKLSRQVRIEGRLVMIDSKLSDKYFKTRPRNSQIAACISQQSKVVSSPQKLRNEFLRFYEKYRGKDIPRPKFWGGFIIIPERIEFWQGQKGRLHDRILYLKQARGWKRAILYP